MTWSTPLYAASQEALPVLETTDFELLSTDAGCLQLTIKADKMCQYENGNLTLTGSIAITLFENKEDKAHDPTHIQADTLSYNKEEGMCILAGNVLVTKPQQQLTIRTEQLSYDVKQEIIVTESSIVVVNKENTLKGNGLRATKDLTKYTITAPSGQVEIKQGEALLAS